MTKYVLGFVVNTVTSEVLLIRKNRPEWQKGKLNGIGGHIEVTDKDAYDAMVREFLEETGVETLRINWTKYATLERIPDEKNPDDVWNCDVFISTGIDFSTATTQTDEPLVRLELTDLVEHGMLISNVNWLIHMGLDCFNSKDEFTAHISYF